MKSLMLKLLMSIAILSTNIYAVSDNEKIIDFFKEAIANSKNYELKDIQIVKSEPVAKARGFQAYFVKMVLLLKTQNKEIVLNDIVFSNGSLIAKDFLSMQNRKSIKSRLTLDVDATFYDKEHLLEGSFDAKNKLVVFSDPLCPFCMEYVPEIIHYVKEHPKDFALFYYNFPLSIHPGAKTLSKAIMYAEEQGIKDVTLKVYEEAFDVVRANPQSVLDAFNTFMGTKFTLEQINQKHIQSRLDNDMRRGNSIMIKGTPTLFINGKIDLTKQAYKTMVK